MNKRSFKDFCLDYESDYDKKPNAFDVWKEFESHFTAMRERMEKAEADARNASFDLLSVKKDLFQAEQRIRESQEQEPAFVIASNSKLGVAIEDAHGNDLPWNTIKTGDKFYTQPIIPPSLEELQRENSELTMKLKELTNDK